MSKVQFKNIVSALIKNNVDVNFDNCLMSYCIENNEVEAFKMLLNHVNNDTKSEMLKLAAKYGHIEIVKLLVKEGVDPHADNNSAIREAVANKHNETADFLTSFRSYLHAYHFLSFCFDLGMIPCDIFKDKIENRQDFYEIELVGYHKPGPAKHLFDCIIDNFEIKDVVSDKEPYKFRYHNFQVRILFKQSIPLNMTVRTTIQQRALDNCKDMI